MGKKPRPRSSPAKRQRAPENFSEYAAELPQPARRALKTVRAAIRSALPAGATETISYRMPAFKREGRMLIWFAAFSGHCSLFPTSAVIKALASDLKGYSVSKGTIQFPHDKPLPLTLIKKIVKARVGQSEGRD